MAQPGNKLDKEKFCCSICLDLLRDPVALPCGHSYCMSCVKNYWDEEDHKETCSCPQCRQTFRPRPVLVKNTMLADLVEDLKKTGLQAAPADPCYAGAGDVACDFCTGRKLKAVKSCLQCLVSYCDQHLQPHYESAAFEKHKLVDPTKKLQESICARHNEVMKIFCRTDEQLICYLCSMDEHKGHEIVSAAEEMTEKLRGLGLRRQEIQQRVKDREKEVTRLQQEGEDINRSADKAVMDSEKIFIEAKQKIRSHQKHKMTVVGELQEKLQQEIAELKRKDTELEKLSHTEDHTQFLHRYTSLSHLTDSTGSSSFSKYHLRHSEPEDVMAAVSTVRDKLQDILSEELTKTSKTETDVLRQQTEPKTRADFFKYSCKITLDPNTAHNWILLDDDTKAEYWRNQLTHYHHPDRFTDWCQVLCRESLTGRCYWEVKWSGNDIFVAVAYKNMSRAGRESAFGNNDKSWALQCSNVGYEFRHNNIRTSIPGPQSFRVGVYLDYTAGNLSFYSISVGKTLLYTVRTTFSQPLCPGLGMFYDGNFAEICTSLNSED
ncbi:hypothetical protein Q5P01_024397 [Channa striata]|uniref:Tripartite motif-containing protein 16-like n=1 Tax=Channa striata TaxID=64152 RepID=A0AA88IRJ4_CHASR|nr:hypothetical protein Q5P01_024397 [Channa striata]